MVKDELGLVGWLVGFRSCVYIKVSNAGNITRIQPSRQGGVGPSDVVGEGSSVLILWFPSRLRHLVLIDLVR